MCVAEQTRARPNIGFGYGFGPQTSNFFFFILFSFNTLTPPAFGYGRTSPFGFGRNSKVSFGIVTASRNSDIEFCKHRIILQPFPNAVYTCSMSEDRNYDERNKWKFDKFETLDYKREGQKNIKSLLALY